MQRNKRFVRIREILYSFDVIYREINEYNITYWSKFLAIVWLITGAVIILEIYMVNFVKINIILKLVLIYFIIILITMTNMLFSKVCSLNSEPKKSYKIFHFFIAEYMETYKTNRISRLKQICKVYSKL